MVNIHIYVDNQKNARDLVLALMEQRLLAHASIDKDNESFTRSGNEIILAENYVITGQTKALLFNALVEAVDSLTAGSAKIYSLPITQCNEAFGQLIRNNTQALPADRDGK